MSTLQPGSYLAHAAATHTVELCTQCEREIKGEVFVRDCEANAPYQPEGYCSQACCDAADEKAYETVYTPRS